MVRGRFSGDAAWMNARSVGAPEGALHAQRNPNIRVMEEIDPVAISQLNDSTWIVDMGQNMVGWLHVDARGRGRTEPVRSALRRDAAGPTGASMWTTCAGRRRPIVYTPGRRTERLLVGRRASPTTASAYVEIAGACNAKPELGEASIGRSQSTTRCPRSGRFETSDPTINQVFRNAYWGLRGNYRSMPTDCPQRDERMGWLGDRATELHRRELRVRQCAALREVGCATFEATRSVRDGLRARRGAGSLDRSTSIRAT